MSVKRSWGEAQKRRCAAKNEWKCGMCHCILPPTFEVDHIIPLHCGGADDIETNAMCCCPNCHREKTQKERIQLMEHQRDKKRKAKEEDQVRWETNVRQTEYSKMVKIHTRTPGVYQCSECNVKLYSIFKHDICPIVEERILRRINPVPKGTPSSVKNSTLFERFRCN